MHFLGLALLYSSLCHYFNFSFLFWCCFM